MAALVTLATTTLSLGCTATDSAITLTSTSGITPGVFLYLDRELVKVLSLGLGTSVNVFRGRQGTATTAHGAGSLITIGRADQFYDIDPIGLPPTELLVSPYINILTGVTWVAQGDETGSGLGGRIWAPVTVSQSVGALGVRVTTTTTPA